MKKRILLVAIVICIFTLLGCSKVKIDYGSSELYSLKDRKEAVKVILAEFDTWEGCELHSITYTSDENSMAKGNLGWLNQLAKANGITEEMDECIAFESSFHSPTTPQGGWDVDSEYTEWQWWLARPEGGEWKLLTWGY